MKKHIFIFSFMLTFGFSIAQNQSCESVLLDDDFSTLHPDWNFTGSQIYVNSGEMHMDDIVGNTENRAIRELSRAVSETYFKMEFSVKVQPNQIGNGSFAVLGAITQNDSDFATVYNGQSWNETNNSGISVVVLSDDYTDENINNWYFLVETKLDNQRMWDMNTRIYLNEQLANYYVVFERVSTTSGILSVYSDAMHTQHIANSPQNISIDAGISNLDVFQAGSFIATNPNRTINCMLDELMICDNIQSAAIQTQFDDILEFYPNPTEGIIHIKNEHDLNQYSVYSSSGELVKYGDIENSEIHIHDLNPGVYFIQLYSILNESKKQIIKVIKH